VVAQLIPGQRYSLRHAGIPVDVRETHFRGVDYELHSAGGWCRWYVMGGLICTLTGKLRGKQLYGQTGMTIENDLMPVAQPGPDASKPTSRARCRL
jgi:hypothetical protein